MNFGEAIQAMKDGKKVARQGWNGKGMYLWLLPAAVIKRAWIKDEMLLSVFGDSEEMNALGCIRMLTATGEILTGWLASQTDMLAEDWEALKEEAEIKEEDKVEAIIEEVGEQILNLHAVPETYTEVPPLTQKEIDANIAEMNSNYKEKQKK